MPPQAATLDPRDARPLTSREIAKVLCGIIGVVATREPNQRDMMPAVLHQIRTDPADLEQVDIAAGWRKRAANYCTWASALSATVLGLRGWCDPSDINTALSWIAENLSSIVPSPVSPTN